MWRSFLAELPKIRRRSVLAAVLAMIGINVIGLYLGRPVIIALLLALLASLVTGIVLARRHGVRAARKTQLPLGPYLAAGGIVGALVGDQLMRAYLHHA